MKPTIAIINKKDILAGDEQEGVHYAGVSLHLHDGEPIRCGRGTPVKGGTSGFHQCPSFVVVWGKDSKIAPLIASSTKTVIAVCLSKKNTDALAACEAYSASGKAAYLFTKPDESIRIFQDATVQSFSEGKWLPCEQVHKPDAAEEEDARNSDDVSQESPV